MTLSPRTALLSALAVVVWVSAPTVVFAAPPADDDAALVQGADQDEAVDQAAAEETGGDAFCPADDALDALDDELDASEVDLEVYDEEDAEADVADELDDDALDFCSEGPFTPLHPAKLSLGGALKHGAFDPGAINLTVPGTIVRELRLAPGATPRAVRRYRSAGLGGARRVATSDGFLDLPVALNATGRKVLRAAGKELRVSVATTLRLASGEHRTRTQVVVLSRTAR